MQQGGPPQPEVVADGGHVVDDLERVVEVVLVADAVPPLDPLSATISGKNSWSRRVLSISLNPTLGAGWRESC